MSEIELYSYVDNFSKIQQKQQIENLNSSLLSFSAGNGNKKAFNKIKEITKKYERERKTENQYKKMKTKIGKLSTPKFTNEQLKNIAK